jgi:hypothetical protein
MEKPTSHAAKRDQSQNNSTSAQRIRLLAALRKHPVSTIHARDELDIMAPAPRVFELRHNRGLNIQTHWKTEPTACGKDHLVAEYVLLPGKWEGKAA